MPEIPPELAERFRRVCPIWAGRILGDGFNHDTLSEEFVTSDGKTWQIATPCGCIVGEAHGRPAPAHYGLTIYNCHACATFAFNVMNVFDSDWTITLERFLDHWEEAHAMEVLA